MSRINKRIRKAIRGNRYDPLEQTFNPRMAELLKEVGQSLRNSKENIKVKNCYGPQQIKIKEEVQKTVKKKARKTWR